MAARTLPTVEEILPRDRDALLVGRVAMHGSAPVPALVQGHSVWDLSDVAVTTSALFERPDLVEDLVDVTRRAPRWRLDEIRGEHDGDPSDPVLLSPIDLQVIKACGVTFAGSMLERVIEERSQGDPSRAAAMRADVARSGVGGAELDLASIEPGSPDAERVKARLESEGLWSQYLEVGLGPYPEVFTKGPVLSSVGSLASIGIPAFSEWNNPEPELVLAVNSKGRPVGATLGNDVNLRDIEGRSALLLGMAKDNNRSTAIGPFVRVFDENFTLDRARTMEMALQVDGPDGFTLSGTNAVGSLSRTFERLISAAWGPHHHYPDGFVLFTGTLFAPTEDRGEQGSGFTHRLGDVVTISSPELGRLVNPVGRAEDLPDWSYGIGALLEDVRSGRTGAGERTT